MKTAEQWSNEDATVNVDGAWQGGYVAPDFVRAVQADALETAANRLREEARLFLIEAGPSEAAQLATIAMQHAEGVIRKLKQSDAVETKGKVGA